MKRVRTIKIYDKYTTRGTDPEIRLTGKWLEACGFKIGHHVEIATRKNKLTITLVPNSGPEKDYMTLLKEELKKKWAKQGRTAKNSKEAAAGYL
ncbi:MAG: type I toxin-antitoxin system SymE family toxin [Leadbetterella sp.]|nr:type I toxin-antitoxin system SymE family toxin [Leadbetterella sp.]